MMKDIPDPPGVRSAAHLQGSAAFGIETLVALGVGVTVVACLYFASAVLIPITLAILLSFLVAPLVDRFARLKLGHVAAVFAAVLISVSVIALLGAAIATQLSDLAAGMPRYQATIERKMETVHSLTIGKLSRLASEAGQALQRVSAEPPQQPAPRGASVGGGAHAPAVVPVEVRQPVPTPFELARRVLSPAVSPLETAFIVFVVMVVILLQREDLRDRAIRLFGARDLHRATTVMDEAARRLSRYFVSQLGLNTGLGVVIGGGLFVIGVPSPVLWGILAALLRLVPYVGIWIAGALATALAAAVSPGWSMAIWSLVLFVTVELAAGQVVEPLLYGRSTGLSPFSVVVAAIFWSWIWGPIGLIVSTPLTLCLLVLGRHVRRLEFLDVLLGDQPALTPVENFYQRALAGDPDEAIKQAETLLREHSLSAYYDAVAIKGLQLAASDVLRGSVTAKQLARIESAINDLVDGLDGYDDRQPPVHAGVSAIFAPTRGIDADGEVVRADVAVGDGVGNAIPGAIASALTDALPDALPDRDAPLGDSRDSRAPAEPADADAGFGPRADPSADSPDDLPRGKVLCIPGRGPLDALATTILLQLLDKHGFSARSVPHDAASRASIDSLRADDAGIVCIFYLQIDGIPSHLRYMVRRIHARLPHAAIVVGLWTNEDVDAASAELESAMSGACVATSLQEMLARCRFLDSRAAARRDSAPIDG